MSRLRLVTCLATAGILVLLASVAHPQSTQGVQALLAQLGLTADQRAAVDAGRPVAKVLPWGAPSEVYVFGAVYIAGSPATYLKSARDVSRFAAMPGYLAVGELPPVPEGADLSALTLDEGDIKALRTCRENDCDVQLPTVAIRAFHDGVNWSQPDAAGQANGLARGLILELIRAYRRGGNAALGSYRDKDHPESVAEQFERMVSRTEMLPNVLPEVRRYLLEYPDVDLSGADSFFYWEKVNFGLKPTVRVNHGVIYHRMSPGAEISVVAIKQLYASHYFHTALDVSVCVRETRAGNDGFYLLTLKGSEQDGLTGVKGGLLRKVAVDKTRSSLERALAAIKIAVEHPAR